MPGKAVAVKNGNELRDTVGGLGSALGLGVRVEVPVGRRIWGAKRRIDVVLHERTTRLSLGLECKFQGVAGSAEEKIPATIEDIRSWPIRGLVVFSGPGFTENMKSYLLSTGMAVELEDLEDWLRLYFAL